MTLRRLRIPWLLMLSNATACVLFVILREPASPEYLAEVDAARQRGGMFSINTIDGTLACRNLYSWSEWHGGERFAVKALEMANAPALVTTGVFAFTGELGVARAFSACTWSWLLAGVFIVAASVQWWLVGIALQAALRWFQRPRRAS